MRIALSISLSSCSSTGNAMQLEAGTHAIGFGDGRAFLGDVGGQAVDSALGEVFTASFARMLVSVTVVIELLAANKVFEDQRVGLAAHGSGKGAPGAVGDALAGGFAAMGKRILADAYYRFLIEGDYQEAVEWASVRVL